MAFKRFGSPEPMKVVTLCEQCKQDRPLIKVTQGGNIKSLCSVCLGKLVSKDESENSHGTHE